MKLIEDTKNTFFDVISDLKSCIFHANDLLIYSSSKDIRIFFAAVILILTLITFRSDSKTTLYMNLLMVMFTSIVSYFIYCLSDYFWFLIKKKQIYQLNLKNNKSINILIKRTHNESNDYGKANFEDEINSITNFYTCEYKTHAKRYAIEISVFLLILFFTFPSFFLFDLALFCGMFVYVFLYEEQSVNQAFDDISSLLYFIGSFYKENPEKCKRFITRSEREEIKDLTKLYHAVVKTT